MVEMEYSVGKLFRNLLLTAALFAIVHPVMELSEEPLNRAIPTSIGKLSNPQ